jgi:lipopolysaccharide export LptBFGC system permease protein LptF
VEIEFKQIFEKTKINSKNKVKINKIDKKPMKKTQNEELDKKEEKKLTSKKINKGITFLNGHLGHSNYTYKIVSYNQTERKPKKLIFLRFCPSNLNTKAEDFFHLWRTLDLSPPQLTQLVNELNQNQQFQASYYLQTPEMLKLLNEKKSIKWAFLAISLAFFIVMGSLLDFDNRRVPSIAVILIFALSIIMVFVSSVLLCLRIGIGDQARERLVQEFRRREEIWEMRSVGFSLRLGEKI